MFEKQLKTPKIQHESALKPNAGFNVAPINAGTGLYRIQAYDVPTPMIYLFRV